MFVDHLQLLDFRSYVHVELPLQAGVTVFVGANGQGKTNLVEAVDYLATLGSHRVSTEAPLVRAGADRALVRGRVRAAADDDRAVVLEVEITPGKANRARLNRSPLPRPRDLLGLLRTVIFSPEDLAVVKGDPSERRGFLDDLVVARWPRLAGVRADYDRVLRQRTTLLKSLAGRRGTPSTDALSTLEVWDEHLARLGAEVLHARLTTLAELVPHVSAAYADIAPTNNLATAEYRTAVEWPEPESVGLDATDGVTAPVPDRATLTDAIRRRLELRRPDELARGLTLVGPHRDDIVLALGDLPVKGYASHGESWSFALALRLGSFQLLRDDGIEPVLVLDDVFAELDTTRRERLAARVAGAEQVLITAAVVADVPTLLTGRQYQVGGGEVHPSLPEDQP